MTDLVSRLNLPWKDRPNRRALLNVICRIGDILRDDVIRLSSAFDSYRADEDMLLRYGGFFGVGRFGAALGGYRSRVAGAGHFLKERGQRGSVHQLLDGIVPGRYEIFEAPRMSFRVGFSKIGESSVGSGFYLVVRVRALTSHEKDIITGSLDQMLDPDIQIIVIPLIPADLKDLDIESIRLYGGSSWLKRAYIDITDDLKIYLIPDDVFTIGSSPVGQSVVYGKTDIEQILIYTASDFFQYIKSRSSDIFGSSLNWEVIKNE